MYIVTLLPRLCPLIGGEKRHCDQIIDRVCIVLNLICLNGTSMRVSSPQGTHLKLFGTDKNTRGRKQKHIKYHNKLSNKLRD